MTGTITGLRGTRFGFIASDADGFDRLRAGQRVRFDQEPIPGNRSRRHAVGVAPLD
jgi:cold shock CspA family protein